MEPRKSSSFQKWKVSSENVDNIPAPLASTQDKSPGSNVLNSEWREILDKNIDKQKISQTFHKSHVKSFKELPKPQPFKFYCKELSTEHNLEVNSITSSSKLNYPSEFPALGERNIKKNNYRTDCFRPSTSILGHGLENKNEIGVIDNEERNKFLSNQKTDDNTLNNHKLDETKASKKIPRTQRPMTVDLFQASESLKMKKLQSKSISKMSKRILKRRVEKKPYGGNILDSDQPLIHKGKIRLNKKKRVTKIKTVILEKRSSWKTKKNEWKLALDSSEKIKLTSDMIKDTLLLKSCNFILHQRKELSSSIGETKSSSEIITECKNQVISSLVNANYSIDELPEEDHKSSQAYLDDNLNIIDSQVMTPKRMIHSKRFAIYCDQWPMAEMTTAVNELLMKLDCFQQKTQACDPLKLYSKRRFNLGLTEVTKYLRLGKIVMVIFATDIEEIDGKGGLLDTINNIRRMASLQKVPYVFANTQKKLKGILKKNARISCIGIRNYEGADTHFKTILELLPEAKRLYKERLEDAEKMCGIKNEEAELDPNVAVVQSLLSKLTSPSAQKDDEVKSAKNNSVEEECPFLSAIIKHGESTT